MFGRKATFGRKPASLEEMKEILRPAPDADGVTRVFSRELWDDPERGARLRELGFTPDDPRNIQRTAADYVALFAAAKQRLQERTAQFNREMTVRHGYCSAAPFLVIDNLIYDGENGAFLYAQLDLIGFDDWNVIMMATDQRTKDLCGLAGHPGRISVHSENVARRVADWKRRYDFVLETFGISATGGDGITSEQFAAEESKLRTEILEFVARAKPLIVKELLRIQG
jgi:hypothetical protein